MNFKEQVITFYLVIFLTDSKEFCFMASCLIGEQYLLVCLKDQF